MCGLSRVEGLQYQSRVEFHLSGGTFSHVIQDIRNEHTRWGTIGMPLSDCYLRLTEMTQDHMREHLRYGRDGVSEQSSRLRYSTDEPKVNRADLLVAFRAVMDVSPIP